MKPTPHLALVLRNGLLIALFLAAVQRLGLPEGLFLTLGVLVVLESDFGGGVIAGRERIVGSLMGLLAVIITAGASTLIPLPAQVFTGMMLVRLFGFGAGLSSGYIVGGHVVAGSLLHHPDDWWHYAFWRTVMTIAGVAIGVVLSRHVYSQRTVSTWRQHCNSWIHDLRASLGELKVRPDHERHFQSLRDQRNALRRNLPKLIAEQSMTRNRQDSVQWAQSTLQHGSTVMSSCRDLSLLMGRDLEVAPPLTAVIRDLQTLGQRRLLQLSGGDCPPVTALALQAVDQRLHAAVHTHLLAPPPTADSEQGSASSGRQQQRHLLASRLLMLSDALRQLSAWDHDQS